MASSFLDTSLEGDKLQRDDRIREAATGERSQPTEGTTTPTHSAIPRQVK